MNKKITVIGATGLIGLPVTKALVKSGFEVTVLVRDVEKAAAVMPAGVSLVKGDLRSRVDIGRAIKNADGVYINLNTTFNDTEKGFLSEREGVDNIVAELKGSTVKQVGFLTSFLSRDYPGDWWVMKVKEDAVKKIKASGVPFTIFRSSSFMENFRGPYAGKGR